MTTDETLMIVVAMGVILGLAFPLIGLRSMQKLVVYSNANAIPIFGRSYSNAFHLHSDMWFHWQLLKGTALASVEDAVMLARLKRLRALFASGFLIGSILGVILTVIMVRDASL